MSIAKDYTIENFPFHADSAMVSPCDHTSKLGPLLAIKGITTIILIYNRYDSSLILKARWVLKLVFLQEQFQKWASLYWFQSATSSWWWRRAPRAAGRDYSRRRSWTFSTGRGWMHTSLASSLTRQYFTGSWMKVCNSVAVMKLLQILKIFQHENAVGYRFFSLQKWMTKINPLTATIRNPAKNYL